jgi:hypothetical protein
MVIHELRQFRLAPGVPLERALGFFHRDGRADLRAALRDAGIPVLAAWRRTNPVKPECAELVWIRAFRDPAHKQEACERLYGSKLWKERLEKEADDIVAEVDAMDLTPIEARALLAGPRANGFHELRHYRLAPGALARMLAFFEDVRALMPRHRVRVLAWWTGEAAGTERFLWLREFESLTEKVKISKELYESDLWLSTMKPRTAGVIDERILLDLEPLPASVIGGHDSASHLSDFP